MAVEDQVVILFCGTKGYLDKIRTQDIGEFESKLLTHVKGKHPNIMETIRTEKEVSAKLTADITAVLEEFIPTCGLTLVGK